MKKVMKPVPMRKRNTQKETKSTAKGVAMPVTMMTRLDAMKVQYRP